MKFRLVCTILLISMLGVGFSAFGADQAQINKQHVIDFFNLAFNQKDFQAASKYLGPYYIQHNPNVEDGIEGIKKCIEQKKENYPQSQEKIIRSFADNNYVILHVHSINQLNAAGSAIIEIFRLENGKIVEHWSVTQNVPEKSANSNGMF